MSPQELDKFLKKYELEPSDFAEMVGLTKSAVNHWLLGRRSIAKPYGRLIHLFDRHPQLMREFNQ